MYTIGEVSEMTGLPISTLRYYDKQGLFPGMERVSGLRRFGETEMETLRLVECLKKSGLEIKDIKIFIDWCRQGESTFEKRLELLKNQKANLEAEIEHMNKMLDMLKFKCWFYEQAVSCGTDENVRRLLPDHLPDEIQKSYDNAHS